MLTDSLKYSIFDPTGNITALIESTGSYGSIQAAAERIMEQHPEVEQAGLVRFDPEDPGAQAELLMAGGEFCGNASMCAAALYFLKNNKEAPEGAEATVSLRVSGARRKVLVKLQKESDKSFRAAVLMPEATGISEEEFIFEGVTGMLPVVTMEGITHIIICEGTAFYGLINDRAAAEAAVRKWCAEQNAKGLGLIFTKKEGSEYEMTPLVYIPGSNTVFWENSCGSGSSAFGMYMAKISGRSADISLVQPGGKLRVVSDPVKKETWIYGRTEMIT